mmetsp:Transcript_17358/g.36390  ORF Transcript_17358/g.36390 Transcript_17358/m.36390 type:complete len:80 (-) Transcript_17358:1158-1397(-)
MKPQAMATIVTAVADGVAEVYKSHPEVLTDMATARMTTTEEAKVHPTAYRSFPSYRLLPLPRSLEKQHPNEMILMVLSR